ncbi:PREDICTED: 3-phosphoinositide-dependent protein kinase 1-like [Priapulus caudatus]|uniref:non-specific serine/threonine protein kinase n=1 Tax=Priapulus caudatus TaxID=37621 RepID=A0ABM1F1V4_PRICU|nr:PREDICTED: 3-phosphoinositide-dependent protein kinase 1-like [Priapulus caudatus]
MAARPELPTTAPPGENDPLFRSRQSEQENARVENGETASGGRPPVGATKPPRPKFGVLPNSAGSQSVSTATAAAGATSPGVTKQTRKRPEDYIFGKILGEGSFATVFLARDVQTHKEYAIKVCDKQQIVREKKAAYVRTEKEVLMRLSQGTCPFFVRLYATFQDSARLYFVLSYAKNGELLDYIRKVDSFDEEVTQFYTAELVMGLEYLHSKNIIHSNEYLTFQKIEKLEYDFPDGFNEVAKDLVLNLLVLDPAQRLGADECGGYQDLKTHPFFSGVRWNTIGEQTAPPIHPYLPASGDNPEVKSEFDVQREAGWNEDDIARMHLTGLSLTMTAATATPPNRTYYLVDPEGYALRSACARPSEEDQDSSTELRRSV